MKLYAVAGAILFEEIRPTTGNPVWDAAIHYGSLAVLCLVLYVLLGKNEARYAALAAGYKEELTASITVRTEIRNEIRGLTAEVREQGKVNEEILRRLCQICRDSD